MSSVTSSAKTPFPNHFLLRLLLPSLDVLHFHCLLPQGIRLSVLFLLTVPHLWQEGRSHVAMGGGSYGGRELQAALQTQTQKCPTKLVPLLTVLVS